MVKDVPRVAPDKEGEEKSSSRRGKHGEEKMTRGGKEIIAWSF